MGTDREPPPKPAGQKSYGSIGEHHWSRARRDANREALEYYRERSRAPGVAAGGAARNFYCMQCDGVIPFEPTPSACPHCGAAVDERVKRYFNWVEINEPPPSDAKALLRVALPLLLGVCALAALLVWWLS
jgi:hypothetical protein